MLAVEYPTIEIDGRTLVVRDSFAASTLMKRRGLDPTKLTEYVGPGKPNSAENWLIIFSAMVAENFMPEHPQRLRLDDAPTADYWMTRIEGSDLKRICDVCNLAMEKAAEYQKRKLALVAPTPMEQAS